MGLCAQCACYLSARAINHLSHNIHLSACNIPLWPLYETLAFSIQRTRAATYSPECRTFTNPKCTSCCCCSRALRLCIVVAALGHYYCRNTVGSNGPFVVVAARLACVLSCIVHAIARFKYTNGGHNVYLYFSQTPFRDTWCERVLVLGAATHPSFAFASHCASPHFFYSSFTCRWLLNTHLAKSTHVFEESFNWVESAVQAGWLVFGVYPNVTSN